MAVGVVAAGAARQEEDEEEGMGATRSAIRRSRRGVTTGRGSPGWQAAGVSRDWDILKISR